MFQVDFSGRCDSDKDSNMEQDTIGVSKSDIRVPCLEALRRACPPTGNQTVTGHQF